MLPPTATVCSPHRVRDSTTWNTATSTTVQMISAHGHDPSHRPTPAALAGMVAG